MSDEFNNLYLQMVKHVGITKANGVQPPFFALAHPGLRASVEAITWDFEMIRFRYSPDMADGTIALFHDHGQMTGTE